MGAADDAARCRALAASERVAAAAALLANVRAVRLRSAARWEDLADRHDKIAAASVDKADRDGSPLDGG